MTRAELEQTWLRLTRIELPAVAAARGWPIRNDHCFQRVLLDNACGCRWYDVVASRPAYRHVPEPVLAEAVAIGQSAMAGQVDMALLNHRSLGWRGKAALRHTAVKATAIAETADPQCAPHARATR